MQCENLIILFDLNSFYWIKHHHGYKSKMEEARKKGAQFNLLNFEEIVDSLAYILCSHFAMNNQNRIILYSFDERDTKKVFPVDEYDHAYLKMLNFTEIRKRIITNLNTEIMNKPFSFNPHSQIIKVLSKSICSSLLLPALNKLKLITPKTVKTTSRIIMFSKSLIDERLGTKLMNCIFVLEHKEIVLDVIEQSGEVQDNLLQSTQKTKGVYINQPHPNKGFAQYMMQVLIIGRNMRDTYKMPYQSKTNFCGSCTCHNKKQDFAWVCSVCLGIYCQKTKERSQGVCAFCGEKYDIADFNQKLLVQ